MAKKLSDLEVLVRRLAEYAYHRPGCPVSWINTEACSCGLQQIMDALVEDA